MRAQITKLQAAQRQIETAIELWFLDRDIVAIHTLAWAGLEILSDLAENEGRERVMKKMVEIFGEEEGREVERAIRAIGNFLKHADRDPESTLDFSPELGDGLLLLCSLQLEALGQTRKPLNFAFETSFSMIHPNFLANEDIKRKVEEGLQSLGRDSLSREESREAGLRNLREAGFFSIAFAAITLAGSKRRLPFFKKKAKNPKVGGVCFFLRCSTIAYSLFP